MQRRTPTATRTSSHLGPEAPRAEAFPHARAAPGARRRAGRALLLAGLLAAASASHAPAGERVEIVLRSGERIEGDLLDLGERVYRVQVGDRVIEVPEGEVASLVFAEPASSALALADLLPPAEALERAGIAVKGVTSLSGAALSDVAARSRERGARGDGAMFEGAVEVLRGAYRERDHLAVFAFRYRDGTAAARAHALVKARGAWFEDKTGTDRLRLYLAGPNVVALYVEPRASRGAEEALGAHILERLRATGLPIVHERFVAEERLAIGDIAPTSAEIPWTRRFRPKQLQVSEMRSKAERDDEPGQYLREAIVGLQEAWEGGFREREDIELGLLVYATSDDAERGYAAARRFYGLAGSFEQRIHLVRAGNVVGLLLNQGATHLAERALLDLVEAKAERRGHALDVEEVRAALWDVDAEVLEIPLSWLPEGLGDAAVVEVESPPDEDGDSLTEKAGYAYRSGSGRIVLRHWLRVRDEASTATGVVSTMPPWADAREPLPAARKAWRWADPDARGGGTSAVTLEVVGAADPAHVEWLSAVIDREIRGCRGARDARVTEVAAAPPATRGASPAALAGALVTALSPFGVTSSRGVEGDDLRKMVAALEAQSGERSAMQEAIIGAAAGVEHVSTITIHAPAPDDETTSVYVTVFSYGSPDPATRGFAAVAAANAVEKPGDRLTWLFGAGSALVWLHEEPERRLPRERLEAIAAVIRARLREATGAEPRVMAFRPLPGEAASRTEDAAHLRLEANESSAISSLRTLVTAQELYRQTDRDQNRVADYAPSLEALGAVGYVDDALRRGAKEGYVSRSRSMRHPSASRPPPRAPARLAAASSSSMRRGSSAPRPRSPPPPPRSRSRLRKPSRRGAWGPLPNTPRRAVCSAAAPTPGVARSPRRPSRGAAPRASC